MISLESLRSRIASLEVRLDRLEAASPLEVAAGRPVPELHAEWREGEQFDKLLHGKRARKLRVSRGVW